MSRVWFGQWEILENSAITIARNTTTQYLEVKIRREFSASNGAEN
jgi:hypothetical protein